MENPWRRRGSILPFGQATYHVADPGRVFVGLLRHESIELCLELVQLARLAFLLVASAAVGHLGLELVALAEGARAPQPEEDE